MTYREIATARGISHAAAIRLVQRRRWQRREGSNDGLAHVLVPHDALQSTPPVRRPRHVDDASPSSHPTTPPDTGLMAGALAALETAVMSLTERASVAERRADEAGARAERAEADRDALRQQLVRVDARSEELRTERDQAHAEAEAARERAADLQAGQGLMMDMHTRALAEAAEQLSRVRDAAEGLRQAEQDRKARGLLARLRAAVRGR
jgi:hypothetical protein